MKVKELFNFWIVPDPSIGIEGFASILTSTFAAISERERTMSAQPREKDPFVAMVTARADVDLKLSDFHPRSMLRAPAHEIKRPKFPVIDYHNHLDAQEPDKVLKIMDECGIERVVNITMQTGEAALQMIKKFHTAAPERFSTYGWMDWSDAQRPGFFERSVERLEQLVEKGACGLKIWKDLGTIVRDADGSLLRIDDERLAPLFEKAAELSAPIMYHIADPDAFFLPIDNTNERYEELAAHPEWSYFGSYFGKEELLAQRDRVFARHPRTTFVGAHVAEHPEDLAHVSRLLEKNSNLFVDIGARCAELGRQPYTAREFFLKFSDRILFGTDLIPDVEMYRLHFRFLETHDEYFAYPSHASRQGRWNIYGLYLPDDALRKVYRENALRLLPSR
jgi:predicted TIM-barrel fold metal-dependent hydrolase